jgi:hypothetical protein
MGKWFAGVLSGVVVAIIVFYVKDYTRPGIEASVEIRKQHFDAGNNDYIGRVTLNNRSDTPMHSCSVTVVFYIPNHKTSSFVDVKYADLAKDSSKQWEIPLPAKEDGYIGEANARCCYYSRPFGTKQRVFDNTRYNNYTGYVDCVVVGNRDRSYVCGLQCANDRFVCDGFVVVVEGRRRVKV